MNVNFARYPINNELSLKTPTNNFLNLQALDISLTEEDEEVIQCRLNFKVSFETYQYIDREALFNLQQDVRGNIFLGGFQVGRDIEIEAALNPELLSNLLSHSQTAKEVANHLLELSKNQVDNPLLETENWYGFYVKQLVTLPPELAEEGSELKAGYSTTWAKQAETSIDDT